MGAHFARRRFALLLAYDGATFHGWQMQPGFPSVQETVGLAIRELGIESRVEGASRTDRGVHARAMVAVISGRIDRDSTWLRQALRTRLQAGIRLRAVREVPDRFHPQFSSQGKSYRYRIWTAQEGGARRFAWQLPSPELPAESMARFSLKRLMLALEAMKGRRSFSGAMAGSARQGLCELTQARLLRQAETTRGRLLTLGFRSDRFGKYMVRTLVGIALRAAVGELDPHLLRAQLDAGLPLTQLLAPPEGLVLWKVHYPPGLDPFPWLTG